MRVPAYIIIVACSLLLSVTAFAEPVFPVGKYADLDAQMTRHERQFYNINALPFGLSLDAHYIGDDERAAIEQYFSQDPDTFNQDFQAVTGKHPYEVLSQYGEFGDLGFFGGVAVVGTAYRYLALKKEGASTEALAEARAKVLHAAESWHVFKVVTGGNGLVARGIRRLVPENAGDPPLPGSTEGEDILPLTDENGNPLPDPKDNGHARADNSGGALPEGEWMWKDSCSKDQMIGQIFAMVALYEAMKDDPEIPESYLVTLQEDAQLIANMLMTKREISDLAGPVGSGIYDLIIMDADGRPTFYHDLNPFSIEKMYVHPELGSYNVFNLFMALGAMKGLHHITGDATIEEYLYKELMYDRDFLGMAARALSDPDAVDYIYRGTGTNFDAPDMISLAMWLSIYLETDEQVLEVYDHFLEAGWWKREGERHTAANCKQPLWHAIYMSITKTGATSALIEENRDLLLAFSLGPYFNDKRINCDEDEIAAGSCIAVDGTTVLTLAGNGTMATEALDPSIRPPSNFDARSNPFTVNGGGGNRLNPGGDLLASYWMNRYMEANAAGTRNQSPNALVHMPVGGNAIVDGDVDMVDTVTETEAPTKSSGGGCAGSGVSFWMLLALGMVLVGRKRWVVA